MVQEPGESEKDFTSVDTAILMKKIFAIVGPQPLCVMDLVDCKLRIPCLLGIQMKILIIMLLNLTRKVLLED
jgi:hypothetical protein